MIFTPLTKTLRQRHIQRLVIPVNESREQKLKVYNLETLAGHVDLTMRKAERVTSKLDALIELFQKPVKL